MKSFPGLESFTFIPMLTEEEGHSKKKKSSALDLGKAAKNGKAGSQNKELMEYMGKLQEIDDDMDYFSGIQSYFKKENILVDVLHTDRFAHEHRVNYFKKMFDKFPQKSLIFLDPDTGLEVKNPTQRHLLFEELKKIYDAMDSYSILMIYQHFPREQHDGYVRHRCTQLHEFIDETPITITDNEIVFFLITKNKKLKEQLEVVLETYANTYPALDSYSCD
jgi:hypothetical protein